MKSFLAKSCWKKKGEEALNSQCFLYLNKEKKELIIKKEANYRF